MCSLHDLYFSVVDITIYYDGFHGDLNETFFVGEVSDDDKQLVQVTYECINQAIAEGRYKVLTRNFITNSQFQHLNVPDAHFAATKVYFR